MLTKMAKLIIIVEQSVLQITINKGGKMKTFSNYVVITDDKGKKRAFYNFHELIKYLDGFKMSFLPDGFSYTIHEE